MKNKLMMVVVLSLMMLFMMSSFVFADVDYDMAEAIAYMDAAPAGPFTYHIVFKDPSSNWWNMYMANSPFMMNSTNDYLYCASPVYGIQYYKVDGTYGAYYSIGGADWDGDPYDDRNTTNNFSDLADCDHDVVEFDSQSTVIKTATYTPIMDIDKTIEGLQPFTDYATNLVNKQDDNYDYKVKKIEIEVAEGYNFIYRVLIPNGNDWNEVLNYNLDTNSVYLENYVADRYNENTFYPLFYESPRDTSDYHYLAPNDIDIWFPSGYDVTSVTVTDITSEYISTSEGSFISVLNTSGYSLSEIDKTVDDTYSNTEIMIISLKVPDAANISVPEDVINYLHVGTDTGWSVNTSTLVDSGDYITGTVEITYNVMLNKTYMLEFSYKNGSDITQYLYDYVTLSVFQDDYFGDFDADQTISLTEKSWLEIMVSPLSSAKEMLQILFSKVNVINMIMPMWMPTEITAMLSGVIAVTVLFAAIRLFRG